MISDPLREFLVVIDPKRSINIFTVDLKVQYNSKEQEEEEINFRDLLKSWKLDKYADTMEDEGLEDPIDWKDLTEDDLKDDLGFSRGVWQKRRMCEVICRLMVFLAF